MSDNNDRVLMVVPTYGAWQYASACVGSILRHTPEADVYLLDDASPNFQALTLPTMRKHLSERFSYRRYDVRGGLLRSWNDGLHYARVNGYRYACLANSDLLFPPGWFGPMAHAARSPLDPLIGPVTNTPGTEKAQAGEQWAKLLIAPAMWADDRPSMIEEISHEIRNCGKSERPTGAINGFCMFATVGAWWRTPWSEDDRQVFCPNNTLTSKGLPNPDPINTLGEYELQRRRAEKRLGSVIAPSYVYHYRSASRGAKYRRGHWATMTERHPWSLW